MKKLRTHRCRHQRVHPYCEAIVGDGADVEPALLDLLAVMSDETTGPSFSVRSSSTFTMKRQERRAVAA
jgi:hypothetical protein